MPLILFLIAVLNCSSLCVSCHHFFVMCIAKLSKGPSRHQYRGKAGVCAVISFYLPYLYSLPLLASSHLPLPSSLQVWFCLYYA